VDNRAFIIDFVGPRPLASRFIHRSKPNPVFTRTNRRLKQSINPVRRQDNVLDADRPMRLFFTMRTLDGTPGLPQNGP
jgi:hypothetical protein